MEDEKMLKNVLSGYEEIEPSADFESGVFRKIKGRGAASSGVFAWRMIPMPVTAVILIGIALLGGSFASAYAGKLKEYGASKMAAEIAGDTFVLSPDAVMNYCRQIKEKGIGVILGPAHLACMMERCAEVAQCCAGACDENGMSCSVINSNK